MLSINLTYDLIATLLSCCVATRDQDAAELNQLMAMSSARLSTALHKTITA